MSRPGEQKPEDTEAEAPRLDAAAKVGKQMRERRETADRNDAPVLWASLAIWEQEEAKKTSNRKDES